MNPTRPIRSHDEGAELPGSADEAGATEREGGISVVAAVIRRASRYLVARRDPAGEHPDRWEFPGGKVSTGESMAEALARELSEELGVRLEAAGRPLYTARDPGRPYRVHFLPAQISGRPRPREHAELRWVEPEELARMNLAPADRLFVEEGLGG